MCPSDCTAPLRVCYSHDMSRHPIERIEASSGQSLRKGAFYSPKSFTVFIFVCCYVPWKLTGAIKRGRKTGCRGRSSSHCAERISPLFVSFLWESWELYGMQIGKKREHFATPTLPFFTIENGLFAQLWSSTFPWFPLIPRLPFDYVIAMTCPDTP